MNGTTTSSSALRNSSNARSTSSTDRTCSARGVQYDAVDNKKDEQVSSGIHRTRTVLNVTDRTRQRMTGQQRDEEEEERKEAVPVFQFRLPAPLRVLRRIIVHLLPELADSPRFDEVVDVDVRE
ncbi:hypothetical protein BLNAU_3893 [Blattamonas nauphoetae]|uniref:Uncharacterized protein n=1 Tax=Blattamonas nauphoetae TaxID=2049346 RepID=A0ABQ9YBM6_9EUKA|nr:hypothetical protein BLNAU_3893 [Blattamonas nauphoetae]